MSNKWVASHTLFQRQGREARVASSTHFHKNGQFIYTFNPNPVRAWREGLATQKRECAQWSNVQVTVCGKGGGTAREHYIQYYIYLCAVLTFSLSSPHLCLGTPSRKGCCRSSAALSEKKFCIFSFSQRGFISS